MKCYVKLRSSSEIASFVERQLDRWTNPNTEKILNMFGAFSPSWRLALADYLVDQRKDSLNSFVALRHKIAHGESVGTSLSQVKKNYKVIVEVVDRLAILIDA